MTISEYISAQQKIVDAALESWVPAEAVNPTTIHRAMRYSLFAGGKRIRPLLAIAAADAVSDAPLGVESAACVLELIHTYSLIHDDLPALDNDDLRRGRPTCHKVFGDAMAILAGDALLTLAFEVLRETPRHRCRSADRARPRACYRFRNRRGDDWRSGERYRGREASFQRHSCSIPSIAPRPEPCCGPVSAWARSAPGPPGMSLTLSHASANISGLPFRLSTTFLISSSPLRRSAKPPAKMRSKRKITFPAVYGIERSREMAEQERLEAHLALKMFDDRAERLRELADLIVRRNA